MFLLPRMMMMLVLLSAGTSLAVDANWLTRIINALRREYRISGQFCLAANIPQGQDPNTLNQVLQSDRYTDRVKETLDDGDVYEGNAVVIAKPVGPVHAEPQVLRKLDPLMQNRQGHVLVIYSYLSPCSKCTDHTKKKVSIIQMLRNKVVNRWPEYAFVFTKLFTQPGYSSAGQSGSRGTTELTQSLDDLADSGLRLRNIFRCYQPPNLEFQCYSCSSQRQVCVDENAQPGQGGSRSSSSSSSSEISRKRPKYRRQNESSSSSNRGRNWDRRNRRRSSSESRSGRSSSRSSSPGRGGRSSSRNRSRKRSGSRGV